MYTLNLSFGNFRYKTHISVEAMSGRGGRGALRLGALALGPRVGRVGHRAGRQLRLQPGSRRARRLATTFYEMSC